MSYVVSNVDNIKKFVSLLERIVPELKNNGFDITIYKKYQPSGCVVTDDNYFCIQHKRIEQVTLLRLLNRACIFSDLTLEMKEIFTNLLLESETELVGFSCEGRIYNTFWPFTNLLKESNYKKYIIDKL